MTATETKPQVNPNAKPEVKQPWLWNVVLLDDQDHSYDYVIRMMQQIFSCDEEKAFLIAERVDENGRAVCMTTHKEHAELKREQIHAFGRDPLMSACKGAMSAIIEPAYAEGDEGADNQK